MNSPQFRQTVANGLQDNRKERALRRAPVPVQSGTINLLALQILYRKRRSYAGFAPGVPHFA
jgi:hypothetical protein